jgi:multimeric flavodoxin WrbA
MKVLAIIGTPTGSAGYTTRSVELLEKSMQARQNVQFDYLYLEDLNLSRCQGHLTCIKFGENRCPFSVEITPVMEAMEAADTVIFASPVHCFNVSTLMKNFIDLLVFQMHRPSFFGKKAIVVATAAGAGQKGTLKYLRKTVSTWGFDVVGQFGTHAGLFDEDKYRSRLIAAADKLAGELIVQIENDGVKNPGLTELINFRVWRSVVRRSQNASPYDWNHWQESGWLDQDYYFPVRVSPVSNGISALVEKIIDRAIRTASVKPVT